MPGSPQLPPLYLLQGLKSGFPELRFGGQSLYEMQNSSAGHITGLDTNQATHLVFIVFLFADQQDNVRISTCTLIVNTATMKALKGFLTFSGANGRNEAHRARKNK